MGEPVLEAAGLRKLFGEFVAVDEVSFVLPPKGSLAIVGESGSGKTTVARMLVGLEAPSAGTIRACGSDRSQPARTSKERRRRGREVQIVFQDRYSSLDPRQRVCDSLDEVLRRATLGERLGDALSALDALGDPALPLAAALRGAARHGAPLTDALERVAVDARVLRRRRAEEDARRLPVQLLFPLVLCVLPAFGLLAVVPLLLASLRSLQL